MTIKWYVIAHSGVFSVAGDSVAIDAIWLDDNNVEITYPENSEILHQEELMVSFYDSIHVVYREKQ